MVDSHLVDLKVDTLKTKRVERNFKKLRKALDRKL